MKKMNIGKKHVILAALIVVLGGAVYVNYLYAEQNGDLYPLNDSLTASAVSGSAEEEVSHYGEAQLVSGSVEDVSEYFTQAELQKTKSRDEAVETVQAVLDQTDLSADEIAIATAKIVEISEQIEAEHQIESLIKAKGFEECVVYLDSESVSVVVQTSGLQPEQAAQIKSIILSQKEVKPENISIVEVNENS